MERQDPFSDNPKVQKGIEKIQKHSSRSQHLILHVLHVIELARSGGVSSVEWYQVPISEGLCTRTERHPLSLASLGSSPRGGAKGGCA